jgi:ArsR family transcriptional regulator
METTQALDALAAVAQETRLRIFRRLVSVGEDGLTPGVLSGDLEIPLATLSFHLKELTHAGLVVARQAGRFIHYSANYATMNDLIAFLTENCCSGETCETTAVKVCRPAPAAARSKARG